MEVTNFQYYISDENLETVDNFTDLGILVCSDLSWDLYIKNNVKKLILGLDYYREL